MDFKQLSHDKISKDKKHLNPFICAGNSALKNQSTDGSMPSGKNGPHRHNMTPARNNGHFAVLFLYLYTQTSNPIWETAARKALDHLMTLRPLNGSFWHRQQDFKSSYNGLIGQSWSLESLIYGYFVLQDEKYIECAREVIELHKFDYSECLWYEVDLDGSLRPLNMTLNQQIWFTAIVASVFFDEASKIECVNLFLSHINSHIKHHRSGLLYTEVYLKEISVLKKAARKLWKFAQGNSRNEIDTGYHAFTLTGLAMLYEIIPDHNFFQSRKFKKILSYCFSSEYIKASAKSKYGYEYNVTGFEMPYIWSVFKHFLDEKSLKTSIEAYKKQLQYYSLESRQDLLSDSCDIETLDARIYEIYRIDDSFWRAFFCKKN